MFIFFSSFQHAIRHIKSPSRSQSRKLENQWQGASWFLPRSPREREKHRFVDLDSNETIHLMCRVQTWTSEQQRHGDQLLAVAVAGSCLPMNFVRDSNIKNWVKYIAPQVPIF